MEITKLKSIHFVGIKGVGMTALACCAQDLGIRVTGSDIEEVFVTDEVLRKRGLSWGVGFRGENIPEGTDLVITTGAHGGLGNPEVLEAKKMEIPVVTHAEALGMFMEGKEGISVCGVGGKTTTASMVATILDQGGLNPSFAIGVGDIFSLGAPGRYDQKGKYFVAEADEYAASPGIDNRPRFTFQHPKIIMVTNIEHDHPDFYPNLEATKKVFQQFFLQIPTNGLLLACGDNKNVREVLANLQIPIETYGFSKDCDWLIENIAFSEGRTSFSATYKGTRLENFNLRIPGRFNVLNATAALAVSHFLGLELGLIKEGLKKFTGTKRRFEFIGEAAGVKLCDDYAHHPTEIKATLQAAREWFPGQRIIAIFQPHTYSRTKVLFNEFAQAFGEADFVFLIDIYASTREREDPEVSSQLLAAEVQKYHPQVFYGPDIEAILPQLGRLLHSGDILLTMGAGDVFRSHDQILKSLP